MRRKEETMEVDQFFLNSKNKNKIEAINLKDISEEKFQDLIAAKSQDKRFYGWLHFHPLFDGSDSDGDSYKLVKSKQRRPRRGSEQINTNKNKENLLDFSSEEADEDIVFFQELYSGISNMFKDAEDEII